MARIVFGDVNPHVIGIVMKELVRRAIVTIRARRFMFEAHAKPDWAGNLNDVVTTADRDAQAIYVKVLQECFPSIGIVAEEGDVRVGDAEVFFTVDPLDGTKAFVRKQSHGIGTMLALAAGGEVIAAYVGDVMTQEIFGYRPESPNAYRISEFDRAECLRIDGALKLSRQNVLLRAAPHRYPAALRRAIGTADEGGPFKGIEVTGGSIGTSMARLWKGEVGAAALLPGADTPWDMCPLVGISRRLGFVFLRDGEDGRLSLWDPPVATETRRRRHGVLVAHESRVDEIFAAIGQSA